MPILPQTKTHTSVTAVFPVRVGVGRKTPTPRERYDHVAIMSHIGFLSLLMDNYQPELWPSRSNTKQTQLYRLLLTWQPGRYPGSCVMQSTYLNSSMKKTVLNLSTQTTFYLLDSAKITLSHVGMQLLKNDQRPCECCGASLLSMLSQSQPLAQCRCSCHASWYKLCKENYSAQNYPEQKQQPNLVKPGAVRNAVPTRATY